MNNLYSSIAARTGGNVYIGVVGPVRTGKSTLIKNYIPYYGLDDVEYICPDIYASELFSDTDDIYERYKKAIDFANKFTFFC